MKRTLIPRIRTISLTFLRHIIRKDIEDMLTLTGHEEDERDRRKLYVTQLTTLCKWAAEGELRGISRGQILFRVVGSCGELGRTKFFRDTVLKEKEDFLAEHESCILDWFVILLRSNESKF